VIPVFLRYSKIECVFNFFLLGGVFSMIIRAFRCSVLKIVMLLALTLYFPVPLAASTGQENTRFIIGCVTAVGALIGGCAFYAYWTKDERFLEEVNAFCARSTEAHQYVEELELLSHDKTIDILMGAQPMGSHYQKALKHSLQRLDDIKYTVENYKNKLDELKDSYAMDSRFYEKIVRCQQRLAVSWHQCLSLYTIFATGNSLVVHAKLLRSIAEYQQQLHVTHHHALEGLHGSPAELEQILAGQDSLKEYWLSLDQSLGQLMNYREKLLELRSSLNDATSSIALPQALENAQQKQLIAIEQAQQELFQFIKVLQHLQQVVGNHPRYHYDNELYLMNNIRQLRQENELLRVKIDGLLATVSKLEREKQSLYEHISNLECSIEHLHYQLNTVYRPIVRPVVITQYR
jgi:hypothetical protein